MAAGQFAYDGRNAPDATHPEVRIVVKDSRRFLDYIEAEHNAALMYRTLAELTDGERRSALLALADMEDGHAAHWAAKLRAAGIEPPPPPKQLDAYDMRVVERARKFGFEAVAAHLAALESADAGMYDHEPDALSTMPSDERKHETVLRSFADPNAAAAAARAGFDVASEGNERGRRTDKSGATRAAVFGISDGLVSNTALVMGFAGAAGGGTGDSRTVLFAGLAGLLAGAFSMAAGEYVSVASQRDLFNRELKKEEDELRERPEVKQRELELVYRSKGLSGAIAKATAEQIMSDPKMALETVAREQLGLDPDDLGSPVKAALSSFIAFAIGASVVVLPYLFATGTMALGIAVALAVVALLAVGGLVGYLSGRGVVFSALRQLAWGAGAAIVTYAVGAAVGVNGV